MDATFPSAGDVFTDPPTADEVLRISRAAIGATAPAGGLTSLQAVLLESIYWAFTGHRVPIAGLEPLDAAEFGATLAHRNQAFRTRIVQTFLLSELVLSPLPPDVVDRVGAYAAAVGVDDPFLHTTRLLSRGSLGLAALDFTRNGYVPEADVRTSALGFAGTVDDPWAMDCHDPELAARWDTLADLPTDTLGHRVWCFYRARGFVVPGRMGSAPPLLAQHDWVHVLADFGTTVESELEVFGFIARANDDPRAFSLLAMVVSLFETGYLAKGAGLFEYDRGHLSHDGVAVRLADAMVRGARCEDHRIGHPDVDFLAVDWFSLADQTVEAVRDLLGVTPRSDWAATAGSVGPWEPGGISPFQLAAGRALAEAEGRDYDSYGACVA